jgi:hypothetical protein
MSTIFFYSNEEDSGAIATLNPTALTTTLTLGENKFSKWTHVVSAWDPGAFSAWTHIVSTSIGWFFYDGMSGAAAIGRLLPIGWDFNMFFTTGSLAPGSLAEWTHIVADGDTLFFYNRSDGSAAIGTVSSTGLTTNLSFAPASFGSWTHVVNYGSVHNPNNSYR